MVKMKDLFEGEKIMLDKNKINNYLNNNLKFWEKKLEKSKSLDNSYTGKDMFIEKELAVVNEIKEMIAFINSELAEEE